MMIVRYVCSTMFAMIFSTESFITFLLHLK